MKKDITALFCIVDDFVREYKAAERRRAIADGKKIQRPTRVPGLSLSEIITIILMFHQSSVKNFKHFYLLFLLPQYLSEFPHLPSYERFVFLMQRALAPMAALLYFVRGKSSSVQYVDATAIEVCSLKRTSKHKVFAGLASLGKTTKGWFFGLKLHLVISDKGEVLGASITPGNCDDRAPVPTLTKRLRGLLFGDKGYISNELFKTLFANGLKLITGIKKNMQNKLMDMREKQLLRKRSIIETVFDYLKNKMSLEHTRHRSITNALVHIISTLVDYQLKPTKPSITPIDLALG